MPKKIIADAMSIPDKVFRVLLIPVRRVPSGRAYQCNNPACGNVPWTLTRGQAANLRTGWTANCRACNVERLATKTAGA